MEPPDRVRLFQRLAVKNPVCLLKDEFTVLDGFTGAFVLNSHIIAHTKADFNLSPVSKRLVDDTTTGCDTAKPSVTRFGGFVVCFGFEKSFRGGVVSY